MSERGGAVSPGVPGGTRASDPASEDSSASEDTAASEGPGASGGAGIGPLSELPDEDLIRRLRRIAAEADPVPDSLYLAARAAFGLRDVDARVAELVRDSAMDEPLIAVRAVRDSDARMLSFETGDTAIECEIIVRGATRDIIGQLTGGTATTVAAEVAGRSPVRADVQAHGFFAVRGLPPGPLRLKCQLADGVTIATSWTPL